MPHIPNPTRDCAPAASLPDLMRKRLDGYLPTLQSDNARRTFLTALRGKFQGEFATYATTGHVKADPVFGRPSLYDFHHTICDIESRLEALTERVAA